MVCFTAITGGDGIAGAQMAGVKASASEPSSETGHVGQPGSLILLVRANPETTSEMIRNTLRMGAQQAGCSYFAIEVREVLPQTIDELEALVRDLSSSAGGARQVIAREFRLEQKPGPRPVWKFVLTNAPNQILTALEVFYGESGAQGVQYEAVSLKAGADLQDCLVAISVSNGIYHFYSNPAKPPPQAFTLHLRNAEGQDHKVAGKFPVVDKCYLIHLRGFSGDRAKLFEVVKDSAKVADPFTDLREHSNVTLSFGSVRTQSVGPGETIAGLELVVGVPGLPNRWVGRVWMLFPLTAEQFSQHQKAIDGLKNPLEELPDYIRNEQRSSGTAEAVAKNPEPRWYELTPSGTGLFETRIKLVDSSAEYATLHSKLPKVYRILVWEFEDSTNPQIRSAISVTVEGASRPYKVEELARWRELIEERKNLSDGQ